MNSTKEREEEKKEEKGRKEHTKANMTQFSKHSIFLLMNSISSLSTLNTNIYKDYFLY